MATKHDFLNQRRLGILLALFVCCVGMGQGLTFFGAKQVYTVDYTIEGMVWVQDAMVNLVDGAWIKDSPLGETGQLWATQGAVVNIYGGQIDDVVVISATVEQTCHCSGPLFMAVISPSMVSCDLNNGMV